MSLPSGHVLQNQCSSRMGCEGVCELRGLAGIFVRVRVKEVREGERYGEGWWCERVRREG